MAGIAEVWFLGTDVAVQRDAGAIDCCMLSHGGCGKVDCCRRMLLSTADSSVVRVSTAGHRLYCTKGVTDWRGAYVVLEAAGWQCCLLGERK